MKKALISPIEPRKTGYRVAQVEAEDDIFETAQPLYWVDCPDDVTVDSHWYDPTNNTFNLFPVANQPATQGTQNV